MRGHLDCLKYAHENGCPGNYEICKYAANKGLFDYKEFAIENGRLSHETAREEHLACIKYIEGSFYLF